MDLGVDVDEDVLDLLDALAELENLDPVAFERYRRSILAGDDAPTVS